MFLLAVRAEIAGAEWSEEELMEVRLLQTKQKVSKKALNSEVDSASANVKHADVDLTDVTVPADAITVVDIEANQGTTENSNAENGKVESNFSSKVEDIEAETEANHGIGESSTREIAEVEIAATQDTSESIQAVTAVPTPQLSDVVLPGLISPNSAGVTALVQPNGGASGITMAINGIQISEACETACSSSIGCLMRDVRATPPLTSHDPGAVAREQEVLNRFVCRLISTESLNCANNAFACPDPGDRSQYEPAIQSCHSVGYPVEACSAQGVGHCLVFSLLMLFLGLDRNRQ